MDNFIETVRVVSELSKGNPTGYVTINKCDLTKDHELFVALPDSALLIDGSIAANQISANLIASGVFLEAPLASPAATVVEPSITGTEEIKLGENDGDVTAATGVKKPWDTN